MSYVDLFFAGALRRSYSLLRGFAQLVHLQNYTCAPPLVRFQLDNVLRVTACVYAEPDAAGFVEGLLAGKRADKMKDRRGERMTDSYLCGLLARDYPWVLSVYRETSGFVHLSEKHMLHNIIAAGEKQENFRYTLAELESDVPDSSWDEIITTFAALSRLLLSLIRMWPEGRAAKSGA